MCEAHRALYVRYIRTHHYYVAGLTLTQQSLGQCVVFAGIPCNGALHTF